jgi:hypothetical protein
MHFKKYFVSVISLLATSQIIAMENQNTETDSNIHNENIGLNLFLTAEASLYHNFKINNLEFKYPRSFMIGSLQAGALYELDKSLTGSLVIGGGVDFIGGGYNSIVKFNDNSSNVDLKIDSIITKGSIGYKFTPSERYSIFTLGHFGYAVNNKITAQAIDLKDKNGDIKNINVKNHIIYGVNLINAINVTNNFDIGIGLGVTGHSMAIENKELNINQKLNYVDVNTSLSLIYKI